MAVLLRLTAQEDSSQHLNGNGRLRDRFVLSILPHVGAESFVRARPKFLSAAHPQLVGSNPNTMPTC